MEFTEITLECSTCGTNPSIEDFLDGCHTYSPETGALKHTCRGCGETRDVRILSDRILFGSAFGIDEPMFTPTHQVSVPHLSEATTSSSVTIYYRERSWLISKLI
jgi:hypothetical protein